MNKKNNIHAKNNNLSPQLIQGNIAIAYRQLLFKLN